LRKAVAQRIPIRIGNRSENFLPIEKEKGLSLELLKALADRDYPVLINTKSDLIVSEPYFSTLSKFSRIAVQFSVIHGDDNLMRKIEPGAPSVSRRLECMRTLNDVGIKSYLRFSPIIPFFNTSEDVVADVARKVGDAGCDFALTENIWSINRFMDLGVDVDTLKVIDNDVVLSDLVAEKVMHVFKKYGVKAASNRPHTVAYSDNDVCCGCGDYFGSWSKYNMWYAMRLIAQKGRMSFTDFDKAFYGLELHESIRSEIKSYWNNRLPTSAVGVEGWIPAFNEGYVEIGRDSEGNIIYEFDPSQIGEQYENLKVMFGGGK
jgi:hypothetical protein